MVSELWAWMAAHPWSFAVAWMVLVPAVLWAVNQMDGWMRH